MTILLGAASAKHSVASYSDSGTWASYSDYFTGTWETVFDAYYATTYDAGEDSSNSDYHYEEYGTKLKAYGEIIWTTEIMTYYTLTHTCDFVFFDVRPMIARFTFYRPEGSVMDLIDGTGAGWDFSVLYYSKVAAGDFTMYWDEWMQTTEYSVGDFAYDAIVNGNVDFSWLYPDSRNDLAYFDDSENEWEDPFYTFNFLEAIGATPSSWQFWGTQVYYESDYIGF